jgi:hypothetical protein
VPAPGRAPERALLSLTAPLPPPPPPPPRFLLSSGGGVTIAALPSLADHPVATLPTGCGCGDDESCLAVAGRPLAATLAAESRGYRAYTDVVKKRLRILI